MISHILIWNIVSHLGSDMVRYSPDLPDTMQKVGYELWRGDFAILLLCMVAKPAALKECQRKAQNELDRLLLEKEQDGRGTMDGYLLLCLSTAPETTEERAMIRDLELDRSVCRKHIIWPDGESWAGLERVTIFNPTLAGKGSPPGGWPADLTSEETFLRDAFGASNGRDVAVLHKRDLGIEP